MKRILGAVFAVIVVFSLTCLLCLGLTGCKKDSGDDLIQKVSEDELKLIHSREGVMFVLSSEVVGPIDWYDDDRFTGATFSVDWDGTITKTVHHMTSGSEEIGSRVLSDYDFMKIYSLSERAYHNQTFKDYSEDNVCDGELYAFIYYPENGKSEYLYSGYCYSNKALWSIVEIADSYFEETVTAQHASEPDIEELQSRSGYMMTISSNNSGQYSIYSDDYVISVYLIKWNGEITVTTTGKNYGETTEVAVLSDEDYMTLYSFANDAKTYNTFAYYHEDGKNGLVWSFSYLPQDEEEFKIYSGFISESEELNKMADLISSCFE